MWPASRDAPVHERIFWRLVNRGCAQIGLLRPIRIARCTPPRIIFAGISRGGSKTRPLCAAICG